MRRFWGFLKTAFSPLGLLRWNLRSLICFELIYRLLTLMVFFPLLTWMQRLFLVFNKTSTIASYNLSSFLRNPMTWFVLLLMGITITVFASFERFAIVDALHASRLGKRRSTRQIFSTGFDLCLDRLRPGNWGLILYTIFVLHFGMLYDFSSVTSFITLPGFLLEDFAKHPWKRALYICGIILMIYLFLRLIFTIPVMMEGDDDSFWKSAFKSWRMTRGKYILRLLGLVFLWLLISQLLYALFTALVVIGWFLLSLWLQPGSTDAFFTFFAARFQPVYLISYIVFTWAIGPLMLASFQMAYYRRKKVLEDPILPYTEEAHYLKIKPVLSTLVWAGIAVCVFFSGPRRFAQIKWMMNTQYGVPLIMAHRGYSAAAPENTLPAFERAIEEGFTAAELDVQMTKDGEIVLLHDSNLKRTTGINKNIWDVTYEEIRDLDNGSFFSKKYAGTRIPTLDEVVKLCKDKLYLNVEIKRTGHDDGITQKVIDILVDNDFLDQCDITSQNYKTIEEVREINPDVLTAYTSIIGIGKIQNLEAADIISINETFATFENISNLHNAGKRVFVWTVNERDTMENLITMNVDAILTNDPGMLRDIVEEYASNAMNLIRRIKNTFTYM